MRPRRSVCVCRILKISSCLRSDGAPSTSRSCAILTSCGMDWLCSVRMSRTGSAAKRGGGGSSTSAGRGGAGAESPGGGGGVSPGPGGAGQEGAVGGLVRGGEDTAAPHALGGLHGVPLRGSHDRRDAGVLEKKHHREVARLRLESSIDEKKGSADGCVLAGEQLLDHLGERLPLLFRRFCVAVARAVHDVESPAHAIPEESLRTARRLRDACHLRAKQGVQQAGLPHVRAAEDREGGHGLPLRALAPSISRKDETHLGARGERTSQRAGPKAGT